MEHQIHYNRKFYQDKKTGYWISTECPKIRAHRWIWINSHGKIPKGFHIHHKDENRSNNSIENLELMEASRHLSLHMTPERRQTNSEWAEIIRPLTKEWHASEEGRAWHRYHALKSGFGKWEYKEYKCQQCGNEYKSKNVKGSRFCSNNCKSQWRRESGIDNVIRECQFCKSPFIINKYSKTKFCGCPRTKKKIKS